jgi:pyridoxal phosphate enzyme (YggS family)
VNLIEENITSFMKEMESICKEQSLNSSNIVVIGASKTQNMDSIEQAYKAGVANFGENYLQEAEEKIKECDLDICWHFIGSIQKRKCKKIAALFDWVHTLERIEVAEKLNAGREGNINKLNVCVQVNIDHEESKSGIALEEVNSFVKELKDMENLRIRGLMAIPDPSLNPEKSILSFRKLKDKFEELKALNEDVDSLSMGMSGDYREAIMEGSSMIRIGTSIFGKRT